MPGAALYSPVDQPFDLDQMLHALVEGRGDWVYSETRPHADAGIAKAQLLMGILHQVGLGTGQNGEEAVRFYRKAAIQNEPLAWKNLGTIYLLGLAGVPADKAEARRCFSCAKAAEISQSAPALTLKPTVH